MTFPLVLSSCGFISRKRTATDVGGTRPNSVTIPLIQSAGVISYSSCNETSSASVSPEDRYSSLVKILAATQVELCADGGEF